MAKCESYMYKFGFIDSMKAFIEELMKTDEIIFYVDSGRKLIRVEQIADGNPYEHLDEVMVEIKERHGESAIRKDETFGDMAMYYRIMIDLQDHIYGKILRDKFYKAQHSNP